MGTCLGFESLVTVLSNYELKLENLTNVHTNQSVHLEGGFYSSILGKIFSDIDTRFFNNEYFYFSHVFGYSMD